MEPEGLEPHSQEPYTCPCPEPDQSKDLESGNWKTFVYRLLIIRLSRKGLCTMNLVISLLSSQPCVRYFLRLIQGMRCMPWKCLFCVYCRCLLRTYAASCVLLWSLGKYVDRYVTCSSLKTVINTVILIDLSNNHT